MNSNPKSDKIAYIVVFLMVSLLSLGPVLWGVVISTTPESAMFKEGTGLWNMGYTGENYERLLDFGGREGTLYWMSIKNSFKATGLTLLLGIPCCILSAYTLSKMDFKGRNIIKSCLLYTMAIPVFMTIIPLYKIFVDWKLLNNIFWISVIYVTSFLPISTWLLSMHFDSIPVEIEEAAYIDGGGRWDVFFRIMLPLSLSMIFSIILIIFIMSWNQFQVPLILAFTKEAKPVSIAVSEFVSKDSIRYGITAAAGIIAMLPPVTLAVLFRRYIIQGISGGELH